MESKIELIRVRMVYGTEVTPRTTQWGIQDGSLVYTVSGGIKVHRPLINVASYETRVVSVKPPKEA